MIEKDSKARVNYDKKNLPHRNNDLSKEPHTSLKRMGVLFGFFSTKGLDRVSGKMFNKHQGDDDEEWLAYSKEYPDIYELDVGGWW